MIGSSQRGRSLTQLGTTRSLKQENPFLPLLPVFMWPPAPFAEDSKTKRDGAVAAEQSTIAADVESTFPVWASLTQMEKQWAYYQPFLAERGYMLRPRYRPGWDPAMLNSQQFPWKAEESLSACVRLLRSQTPFDCTHLCVSRVWSLTPHAY
jgi:hypothetical protein